MRFISRRFHAVMDYMVGIILIASPWLLNFSDLESAKWVAIVMGVLMLGMSFMTDYEGGGMKIISMSGHLTMDVISGIFLAASPWLLGFADQIYLPHLIIGILEIGAGLCTVTSTEHPAARHLDDKLKHAH